MFWRCLPLLLLTIRPEWLVCLLYDRGKLALQEKGIQTFERSLPDGKVRQIFFFDPDGKLL
jgi:hypothetical protein